MSTMSHELSLACYRRARDDASVSHRLYEDLESLLCLFGQIEGGGHAADTVPFAFELSAPTLLIVDDESELADMLCAALVRNGYPKSAIRMFQSGEEAILFAQEHAVGIALLDIRLQNPLSVRGLYVSGLKVLRIIKQRSPGAKVVLMSGFGTSEMVREAILVCGASYYLGKPLRISDVIKIVHWAVDRVLGPDIQRVAGDSSRRRDAGDEAEYILVVDDDLAVSEGLMLALRALGYRALAAQGGREALSRLAAGRFDAVILDIKMPHMDGLEVLRQIRREGHDVVVLMLTAYEDETIAREAMRLGAYDFLSKPCDLGMLQLTLELAFGQRRSPAGS